MSRRRITDEEFEAARARQDAGERAIVDRLMGAAGPDGWKPIELRRIDFVGLQDQPVPEREWLVPDWIPLGHVTMLYGPGGTGKSLLAQQLLTAVATQAAWLGMPVAAFQDEPCPCIGIFCEDDEKELVRRQAKINRELGVDMRDLGMMRAIPMLGSDSALVTLGWDGLLHETLFFNDVVSYAQSSGARLIVLDNAAQMFGGNENDRFQVTQFLNRLTALAQAIKGAVVLCGHPSKSSAFSGSTAWEAAVRVRLDLNHPADDGTATPDPNLRVLTRAKANYAARGDELRLVWSDGAFAPEVAPDDGSYTAGRRSDEAIFIDALHWCSARNIELRDAYNSPDYAPRRIAALGRAPGLGQERLTKAMNRLISNGDLVIERCGAGGRQKRLTVKQTTLQSRMTD